MNRLQIIWNDIKIDTKAFFTSPIAVFASAPLGLKVYYITDGLANTGLVLVIIGIILGHQGGYPLNFMFTGIGLLLIAIGFFGGLGEVLRKGKSYALVSVVVWGIILAFPLTMIVSGWGAPPIHDITTDLKNPPQFQAVVKLRPADANSLARKERGLKTKQRKAYPKVRTLRLYRKGLHPAKVFEAALALAKDEGWEVVAASPRRRTIEAIRTSFFLAFKDDVVIRIGRKRGKRPAVLVDMRSVSRRGESDLGKNAELIEGFLGELKEQFQGKKRSKK